jgi:hypothetical protein
MRHSATGDARRRLGTGRATIVLLSVMGVVVGTSGALALALAVALDTPGPSAPHKTATSSPRDVQSARYQQLVQETAQESGSSTPQPPNQSVGTGWSAPTPSLPTSVPPKWSPLVISALEVFEHETHNDQPATLTMVQSQSPQQVDMAQGPVEIESLSAFVGDGQAGSWIMSATSQQPFSAGGSVMFRGGCTWTSSDTSQGADGSAGEQTGTCPAVLVTLVGDPSNPYSAGVAQWTTGGTRVPMTITP